MNQIVSTISSNSDYHLCMQDKGAKVTSVNSTRTKTIEYQYDEGRGNIMPPNAWVRYPITKEFIFFYLRSHAYIF